MLKIICEARSEMEVPATYVRWPLLLLCEGSVCLCTVDTLTAFGPPVPLLYVDPKLPAGA